MRLLFAAVFALFAWPALAQTGTAGDPYEGRVAVADQSPASRDRGLREALAQVVERVSGPGASAGAASVLARAGQLVQRYGFDSDESGALQLVASFDRNAVDGQLRGLGLPVWGYSAAPAEDTAVTVSGLARSEDYAKVMAALRAVPGVRRIAVQGAEADRLLLEVRAEGGAERLLAALGGRFARDPAAANGTLGLRLLP